jgi:2'-5' RNA ligase
MLRVISKKHVKYEFSSVQFNLPKGLAEKVKNWGKKNISSSDLFSGKKYGRENEIHVTVKYGLHTTDDRKIRKIIEDFGSFDIRLGKISRFVPTGKDYDVVKIEIDSDKLSELNRLLGSLPNSDEHPVYNAHCTVAYINKGCCKELSGNTDLRGEKATVRSLVFSSKTGDRETIDL